MRIIVGMSGGVDSALAAALLKKRGMDAIGVTLQLYSYKEKIEHIDPHKKHCHPLAFIHQAQKVADDLKIPHHVINQEALFQSEIIDPFMESYRKGKTPLPCVRCNRDVKTALLYQMMQDLGAEGIATGHYVRRVDVDGVVQLHQGQDLKRDQSFFLFALTPAQLKVMHFPLGQYSKEETRAQALALGLSVAHTPASQDLCFIAKRSYKTLFEPRPGEIYHIEGHLLGTHQGLQGYTVGQRQGLGVGGQSAPLHVIRLDTETNRVIVGPRECLARTRIVLEEVNWLAVDQQSVEDIEKTHIMGVRIRSSGMTMPARVTLAQGAKKAVVELESPDYAIAPGQACVFYQGTRLLGGGWITEAA